MRSNLSIASVCRSLPNPDDPSSGIFVFRRLAAMAARAPVTTIQPIPYFPLVKPLPSWAKESHRDVGGVRVNHAPMFYLPKFFKSLDGYWLYQAILRRLTCIKNSSGLDIVDAHFGYPEGVGAFLAAKKLGLPFFVTLRGFEAEYLRKPIIGSQIKHLIQNAQGCICVSHFLKDLAVAQGARPENVRVIHNAVDERIFFPANQSAARMKLNLPEDVPIVISVGHLVLRKRHHVLISAFSEFLKSHPAARLLIAGGKSFEHDYVQRLNDQVEHLQMHNAVEFLGNIKAREIADYLRAADVFALGTQREGCCNAVLEALACGLPVITTPVGDNTRFVKNGENGYIVPVDDRAAMSKALASAVNVHGWDRNRIAASLSVGDWGRVAADVLDFFADQTRET